MSNPFRTKEFRALEIEWRERLASAGFDDHEDDRGRLKQYDRRTQTFTNRERVTEFFRLLDSFLNEESDLPDLHRKILEQYAAGIRQRKICKMVNRCERTVRLIISTYRKLISG